MTTQSSPLKGSAAGILDYLYDEVLGYYEAGPGDAPRRPRDMAGHEIVFGLSQIHGQAPSSLGIDFTATGGMTKAQFYALAAGRHPVTGDQLVERRSRAVYVTGPDGQPLLDSSGNKFQKVNARTGEPLREVTSHVGIDVYFAAPKSVSIARVVAEEENPALGRAISEAHGRAVSETLRQIETSALLGRRTIATPTEVGPRVVSKGPRKGEACLTQGSATERVPVELLVVSVAQHCARPTEETNARGAPPDMHLHQHNLIMNVGVDPVTGKACAIDDYGLKAAAAKHDAWYLGHLSRELQGLGLELEFGSFEDSKHGRVPWRVKGIGEAAEDHYSSNRRRAWDLAKDYEARHPGKAATPSILKERMRGTRLAKDEAAKAQDSAPVWQLWTDDARRAGMTLATEELRQRMREGHRVAPGGDERREVLYQRLHSPKGLTMDDATFTGAGVSEALARCSEGLGYSSDELMHLELELYASLVIVRPAREPRHIRYTTQSQLDMERRVDAGLRARAAALYPAPPRKAVSAALRAAEVPLDGEQESVVRAACSGRGVVFIEGLAGTGKTTALAAAVTALRDSGAVDQVVVVSTAARTARAVGVRLNADVSGSVESVASAVERGSLTMTPSTVVIYDESAMSDTRRQDRFLAAAGPARLIYAGDPHQAQAIGPAGWYRDITEALGTTALTVVHRQKDPADIAAFAALRAGRAPETVASLAARGRIHMSNDAQEALARVVEHYRAARDEGRSAADVVVLLDSSNAQVDTANRQIQHLRRERGEIPAHGFEVEETQTGRHWSLHPGDPVITLAPCDAAGGKRLANGTTATVEAIEPGGEVTLVLKDSGERVQLHLRAQGPTQPVGLAYAVHTAKYQGAEAPVVLAMPGARGQSTKFSAYSTLTRATEEVHVFPDRETHGDEPLDSLGRAWQDTPEPQSARRMNGEAAPKREPEAASQRSKMDQTFIDQEMRRLGNVIGPEQLNKLRASESLPAFEKAMIEMREAGHNVTAEVRRASRTGTLGRTDPAAETSNRLADAQRDLAPGGRRAKSAQLDPETPQLARPQTPPLPYEPRHGVRPEAPSRAYEPRHGARPEVPPLPYEPRHGVRPAGPDANAPRRETPARTAVRSTESPVSRAQRSAPQVDRSPGRTTAEGQQQGRRDAPQVDRSPGRTTAEGAQPRARQNPARVERNLSQAVDRNAARSQQQDQSLGRGLKR